MLNEINAFQTRVDPNEQFQKAVSGTVKSLNAIQDRVPYGKTEKLIGNQKIVHEGRALYVRFGSKIYCPLYHKLET
ncbi:hypothetical protein J31TS3_33110 [Paenibacillus lactis]|nr:hypothetical protein J31TS3_33110 [Paenibacillus lactis]